MSYEVSVTVVYAQSDSVAEVELRLAAGATVAQALETAAKAGLNAPEHAPVGIFGKRCPRDAVVKHGDRIEVYRRLIADPKDSRRRRARVHR